MPERVRLVMAFVVLESGSQGEIAAGQLEVRDLIKGEREAALNKRAYAIAGENCERGWLSYNVP